jgi:hypothetical protein
MNAPLADTPATLHSRLDVDIDIDLDLDLGLALAFARSLPARRSLFDALSSRAFS